MRVFHFQDDVSMWFFYSLLPWLIAISSLFVFCRFTMAAGQLLMSYVYGVQ